MYNPTTSLKNLREFRKHEDVLEQFEKDYAQYVKKLFAIRTRKDAQRFADEIATLTSLLSRWNFDPVRHRCIRGKLGYVRKLKKGLEERASQLNFGEIKGVDLKKLYPTLAELAEKYGQEMYVEAEKEEAAKMPKVLGAPGELLPEAEEDELPKPEELEKLVEGGISTTERAPQKTEAIADEKEKPKEDEKVPAKPSEIITASSSVDLRDAYEFFTYSGLTGEDDTRLISILAAQKLLSFGYISLSGTGKSVTTYIVKDIFPSGTMYVMELGSDAVVTYEADEINKHRMIFLPELQKAMESKSEIVKNILKNVTEGRDGVRNVTNSRKGVDKYTIRGDLGVMFAMTPDHKVDVEFLRRVFVLQTDISPEQTRRVIEYIIERSHPKNNRKKREFRKLKKHMKDCLDLNGQIEQDIPCLKYIGEFIPERTVRARSYVNYLIDMINASAQFHHGDRVFSDNILVANMTDVHLIMEKLFWKHYMKGLLGIPIAGEETLRIFQENKDKENDEGMTKNEIYTKLSDINCDINEKIADSILDSLVRAGFLYKDSKKGNGGTRYLMRKEPPNLELQGFSMQKCLEDSVEYITREYGREVCSEWLDSQVTQGNRILAYDPFGGPDALLAEVK